MTHQAQAVVTGFAQPRQGVRLSPDGAVPYGTNFVDATATPLMCRTWT